MFCLLCLVAVAELRHLEMMCARWYSVLYVNMYICKMDSCGWHCACLIHVWEAVHDMCFVHRQFVHERCSLWFLFVFHLKLLKV